MTQPTPEQAMQWQDEWLHGNHDVDCAVYIAQKAFAAGVASEAEGIAELDKLVHLALDERDAYRTQLAEAHREVKHQKFKVTASRSREDDLQSQLTEAKDAHKRLIGEADISGASMKRQIDSLQSQLAKAQTKQISRFDEDSLPVFTQGASTHELASLVDAEWCTWAVKEIESLRTRLAASQQGAAE